jgi:hypothetical protein
VRVLIALAISVACAGALLGCSGSHTAAVTTHGTATRTVALASACQSQVLKGVLPVWARTGFSDPRPRMPHVLGRSGRIAAIVFGYPLLSPPSKTYNNKILWVSKGPLKELSNLRISAQRMDGSRPVGRPVRRLVMGGPGPSIIDLPVAGCWRMSLAWSGRTDQIDLTYRRSM